MRIYTIGFTKKSAKEFFEILEDNNIEKLVDIRLNNTSQLAGFTKKNDFKYFLKRLSNIEYYYFDFLAPTKEIRNITDWEIYTEEYLKLLKNRDTMNKLNKDFFKKNTCFLCSEPLASQCHRGILTEYLKDHWKNINIIHL